MAGKSLHCALFQFVTLTTPGYGDISPALPLPRFFVLMGAIAGVCYMSILAASLTVCACRRSVGVAALLTDLARKSDCCGVNNHEEQK
jgi:hypothetical protein